MTQAVNGLVAARWTLVVVVTERHLMSIHNLLASLTITK